MTVNGISVRDAGSAVGAEISGVDLSRPLTEAARETIRHALAQRGVVFFRDQSLTPDQPIGLARQFGCININHFFMHAGDRACGDGCRW